MSIRLDIHSRGYRILRVDGDDVEGDGPRFLMLHRLTLFAEGVLDSPSASVDDREVHHVDGCPGHNSTGNLDALDAVDHGQTTRAAEAAQDAPDIVGVEYGPCGSCEEGRPLHVRSDGARRCVVCSTVSEVDDAVEEDRRVEA